MTDSAEHVIFVYGTLKRGFHNHALLANSKFVGTGRVPGFDLFRAGIPFAVPGDGEIHGELFSVSDSVLARLDALEGHPTWYRRTPVTVTVAESVENVIQREAEMYVYQGGGRGELVPDGVYR